MNGSKTIHRKAVDVKFLSAESLIAVNQDPVPPTVSITFSPFSCIYDISYLAFTSPFLFSAFPRHICQYTIKCSPLFSPRTSLSRFIRRIAEAEVNDDIDKSSQAECVLPSSHFFLFSLFFFSFSSHLPRSSTPWFSQFREQIYFQVGLTEHEVSFLSSSFSLLPLSLPLSLCSSFSVTHSQLFEHPVSILLLTHATDPGPFATFQKLWNDVKLVILLFLCLSAPLFSVIPFSPLSPSRALLSSFSSSFSYPPLELSSPPSVHPSHDHLISN